MTEEVVLLAHGLPFGGGIGELGPVIGWVLLGITVSGLLLLSLKRGPR